MGLNDKLDKENKKLDEETMLFRMFYMKNMANKEVFGPDEPAYVK